MDISGDVILRELNKLTAAKIKNAPPGKYSDGAGLWLHKREDGGAQWVLRVSVHGRRREMGLGGYDSAGKFGISLKMARLEAQQWQALARQGQDPIKVREKQRRDAMRSDHTLAVVAHEAYEA